MRRTLMFSALAVASTGIALLATAPAQAAVHAEPGSTPESQTVQTLSFHNTRANGVLDYSCGAGPKGPITAHVTVNDTWQQWNPSATGAQGSEGTIAEVANSRYVLASLGDQRLLLLRSNSTSPYQVWWATVPAT